MAEYVEKRTYVAVRAEFDVLGNFLPTEIIWEDGRVYEIDRVLDVRPAASLKSSGRGDRFTVRILGRETYLFFERGERLLGNNLGRWFVVRK